VEHLSQEQLDAMVMGTVSWDDETVRRHLATCEACARRLARAAQLESDLYDAAAAVHVATPRARSAPMRMWQVALPVAAALVAVAFAGWSVISREKEVAPPRAASVRTPYAHAPDPASPGNSGPDAGELSPQDICRCVTVELSPGPPTDPGGSLCAQSPLGD
jgi:hypothetical protein